MAFFNFDAGYNGPLSEQKVIEREVTKAGEQVITATRRNPKGGPRRRKPGSGVEGSQ